MRSILVHAIDDGNFEARLQAALDLSRAFDAHLTLVQTIAYDLLVPTDPFGVSAVEVTDAMRKLARDFRDKVEARLRQEDVRWEWRDEAGYEGRSLVRHAALNDLAIVGSSHSGSGGRAAANLAGMLAIHCRTPIMVVPDDARGLPVGKAAAVCWNGSMECAHAARLAVPLLARASAVHILRVGQPAEKEDEVLPPSAGAAYLQRHGVDCEIVDLPSGSETVAETLHKAAEAREADFMVMGAYGQARIVETLFGGVTRSVLAKPPMPVLMAH